MTYDKRLFDRISVILKPTKDISHKKMFGGICFMHRGNMLCGIDGTRLMVRVGPDQYEHALSLKSASVMDITGKPMTGFVFVSPAGTKSKGDLKKWINLGLNFTSTLPFKSKKNANAFVGVICSIENTVWTKATLIQRRAAHAMVSILRKEFGLPPAKKKLKKTLR